MKSIGVVLISVLYCTVSGVLRAQVDAPTDPRQIVTVHDTSANPFILPQNGKKVGDPFPVYWDGVWHLYSLRAGLSAVLHFTSTDLVKWTEHEPAMVGKGIATGTVVRHDNKFYMFYTDARPQTIRLVVSDNPWHFDFSQSKLAAKADNKVYQLSRRKFRDCYVFHNEKERLWWMLVEAASDNAVAAGLFKSKDLLTWTQHDPIFKDKSRRHGSCPQVFEQAGRWYLTLLDYGTWYYWADTPYGPWKLRGQYHSKFLTAASRLATDGKRRLCWGFFAKYNTPERKLRGYGGSLGVGRELVFNDDGAIGVRPLPELIAAIQKPQDNVKLFNCAREFSGKWEIDAAKQVFRCTNEGGGVLLLDLPDKNPDYYFEAEIELPSPESNADIVVRTSESLDRGYRIAIEPGKKKIAIRQSKPGGGTFNEKDYTFAKGKPVKLQVFVCGNQIEAFVDGQASLSTRVLDRLEHRVAIEITGGRATISKPLLHYFKYFADTSKAKRKPNFVVIFIDDMGYGDIEPFGSRLNKTPQLNRMAAEGMKLTSFYVAAPVCTPSRAALMTGCYPKRVGLATGSWHGVLFPKDQHGLNPKEKTIARVLKDAGYATGCFGKWHLGDQPEFLPTNHGFDTYFGIPYSNDMWPPHPGAKRWKNGVCPLPVLRGRQRIDIVKNMDDQAQLCKSFTDEAATFIRKNRARPFFVYLPHAFVHRPRNARKEFMDRAGAPPELDERKLIRDKGYLVRERTRAQIEEVDWSVGRILEAIRELGLAENTLVLFTSDNGGAGGCSSAPLRGGKGSTWEGGMREPTLAWWPGTIPANSTCDEIATTMDLLPTFAALGGGKVPEDRVIDGKNIAPLLLGRPNAKSPHQSFLYYRGNGLQAVRSGQWKLHTNGQLYNLQKDIGERQNVAKQNPDIVTRLRKYLDEARADLDDPKNCRPVGKNMNPQYLVPLQGSKENQ